MGIELFQRTAEAGGRILRAERLPAEADDANPLVAGAYLLTFDLGRILVSADVSGAALKVERVESRDEIGDDFLPLDEEEPWWRITGCPITRVWPVDSGAGAATGDGEVREVRLQFRHDGENPKVVCLRFTTGRVHVAIDAEASARAAKGRTA